MASDVATGDSELPFLDVSPADTDTEVTLTVHPPTGDAYDVVVAGGDLEPIAGTSPTQYSQRWTATTPVEYAEPGKWVLNFAVTGTGEGAEDLEVYVVASPLAGGPTWTPGRSQVAKYVPWLTVSLTTPGSQTYLETFSADTSPSGVVADRHIADAANLVTPLAAVMPESLHGLAGTVTALYAAASLAAAYARSDDDAQRAAALLVRASGALKQLETAIQDLSDGALDGLDIVYPVWSFPAADLRYDSPQHW
jgi:hypothetical protein